MGHALEEMRRCGLQTAEGRAADQSFHRQILLATRNESLITLATSVTAVFAWTTRFARDERKESRGPMPDHDAVCDAIMLSEGEEDAGPDPQRIGRCGHAVTVGIVFLIPDCPAMAVSAITAWSHPVDQSRGYRAPYAKAGASFALKIMQ